MTRRGFTLIELLLVIGIIAILAAVVIVAINPTKQLGDARNAQRRSDVNTILNAVYQYAIDNQGNLPAGVPTGTAKEVCQTDVVNAGSVCGSTYVELRTLTGSYVVKMPKDPQRPVYSAVTRTNTGTNYFIVQAANGRITVTAPGAEQGATITVTR